MKQKITLKDIARELEVSISTVSKALKNSEEISTETKKKIQAFAKYYNYKPNNIAVSLKNRRTKNIGVLIPNIVHHFFTTVFRGIEEYANTKGYNVIVCVSDESFDKEVISMELLANGSIDGFIMALSAETQLREDYNHINSVLEQGIPLVLFDRVSEEVICDKVVINDKEAAYMAVKKLIETGKKRIALITTEDFFSVSKSRGDGYLQALKDHSIALDENLILRLSFREIDEEIVGNFFESNNIDAALCVNEIFAMHSMRIAQKRGLKVPEEVSFIGFTDGILSKFASPTLTSVDQHGEKMGAVAARMLIERVEGQVDEEQFVTEVLKATLIERGSTLN